jgi:hypothetical protein
MADKKLGPRTADDPLNLEGSGYHVGDLVKVQDDNRTVTGRIESVHQSGKKIDVRIDQSGHSNHGRIVTFAPDDVDAHPDFVKSYKKSSKASAASE